jgi:hypothetical protein
VLLLERFELGAASNPADDVDLRLPRSRAAGGECVFGELEGNTTTLVAVKCRAGLQVDLFVFSEEVVEGVRGGHWCHSENARCSLGKVLRGTGGYCPYAPEDSSRLFN